VLLVVLRISKTVSEEATEAGIALLAPRLRSGKKKYDDQEEIKRSVRTKK
jgi:hypothetical protein